LLSIIVKRARQFFWGVRNNCLLDVFVKDIYCVGRFSRSRKSVLLFNGTRVYIGPGASFGCKVTFNSSILIGPNVSFVGADHVYDDVSSLMFDSGRPLMKGIVLEDDVWIGHGAIIMDGVRVARHSIVAAGAIVTKDTEPFSINAGCPSRVIKYRFDNEESRSRYLHNISNRIGA